MSRLTASTFFKRRHFCLCSWNFFWKFMLIWSKWSPLMLEWRITWRPYFKNPWEGHWSCFSPLQRNTVFQRKVLRGFILSPSWWQVVLAPANIQIPLTFSVHSHNTRGPSVGDFHHLAFFLLGRLICFLWGFIPQITYLLLLPAPEHGCLVIPHCGFTLLSQLSVHNKQSFSFPWRQDKEALIIRP